jgi:predicted AlkP superfamily phosphohydrolase/phosphomutase/tetratricopeptide (TPR) repeat protein
LKTPFKQEVRPTKILLVGWDAADWKVIRPLMDAGKMPNVRELVENGCSGPITTLHPALSPMLWTSIATGKRPFQHGIHGFSEPTPDGRGIQPVSNLSRTSKALWNILHQNQLRSIVIGWWPSHPAEPIDGVMVSDHFHRASGPLDQGWPLRANSVHPKELAETLADLRVHPDQITPEMVEPFIPLAHAIDQDQDQRLAAFLRTLAECMSVQSAALWLAENQPWDFFAVYFDAIDHFCHSFMRYHPPRQSWIGEREFELYHNVVAMAYQVQDQMLGALLEKANDAAVILMSDHGFHPDHLRPASIPDIPAGPAIEHRDHGILAMRGPGIKPGEILHGASLLDVAPTILTLFGLPVGEDMDGKVLTQAFVDSNNQPSIVSEPRPQRSVTSTHLQIEFIPSWEQVSGADGSHPKHMRLDPIAAHEALEQMIALGYIERPDENRELAVQKTIRELRYNLGEAYQDADRHWEAYEIFRELWAADPDEQRFAVRLFVSAQALGMLDEMRRIVTDLQPAAIADYLKAQVWIAEKRYSEALEALERVREAPMVRPGLFLQTADLYLRLGRRRDAQRVYERALEIDPDNAQALVGMSRMALAQRKFASAAQFALDALQRIYHSPQAHFLLGRALTGMKEFERAAEAFRVAISFNSNFPEAHARLAGLLEKHLRDFELAQEHRRLARRMRRGKKRPPERSVEDVRGADPLVRSRRPCRPGEKIDGVPKSGSRGTRADQGVRPTDVEESLIVVTGLPRSGTSALMQMLAAGGVKILSDGLRPADEDNPRGYLEFEPVKNLLEDSSWLLQSRGKAVKIVAPLLAALPVGLACRVILCERNLDEVLDSQERMLVRRNSPERRRILKEEYARTLGRAKSMLAQRPETALLVLDHNAVISEPRAAAERLAQFLGGGLDVARMAAAIDPRLHRNRAENGIL